MLVLNRKKQEQIVIDEDIFVTVIDVQGSKVRLGVEAPKGVPVHRKGHQTRTTKVPRPESGTGHLSELKP